MCSALYGHNYAAASFKYLVNGVEGGRGGDNRNVTSHVAYGLSSFLLGQILLPKFPNACTSLVYLQRYSIPCCPEAPGFGFDSC